MHTNTYTLWMFLSIFNKSSVMVLYQVINSKWNVDKLHIFIRVISLEALSSLPINRIFVPWPLRTSKSSDVQVFMQSSTLLSYNWHTHPLHLRSSLSDSKSLPHSKCCKDSYWKLLENGDQNLCLSSMGATFKRYFLTVFGWIHSDNRVLFLGIQVHPSQRHREGSDSSQAFQLRMQWSCCFKALLSMNETNVCSLHPQQLDAKGQMLALAVWRLLFSSFY